MNKPTIASPDPVTPVIASPQGAAIHVRKNVVLGAATVSCGDGLPWLRLAKTVFLNPQHARGYGLMAGGVYQYKRARGAVRTVIVSEYGILQRDTGFTNRV